MKIFPARGTNVSFAGRTWRVDDILHCASTCSHCQQVHEDYQLGEPGRSGGPYVSRARGCLVGAA